MKINSNTCKNIGILEYSNKKNKNSDLAFTASGQPVYAVKNASALKKVLPTIAFASSILGSLGYLVGASGLFYDISKTKKTPKPSKTEGVATIEAETKFGKIGINAAKFAVAATGAAGMACGIGEGIPLMALGEAMGFASSSIINTPAGTGLFGIGIASIFAGLALENTPELALNKFELMAEKSPIKKTQMILKNCATVAKEISKSIVQIFQNLFKQGFIKDNIIQGIPKTVVFKEEINKDGKVFFSKMLRHNKNYVMNAASFVLALGGGGLVISSILDNKKAQKISLKAEEGGFLFDNFGMTRYGLDKLTTNGKSAGLSFAIGGVINAISQFLGIDNKQGRALQWLGISGVFLGFSIDRGKHLQQALKNAKQRPELRQVIREWKFDLSKLLKDKTELKQLLKQIKIGQDVNNKDFIALENKLQKTIGQNYKQSDAINAELEKELGAEIFKNLKKQDTADFEKTKEILNVCSEKIFGSKNPVPIK